jgi:hypothetical protein
MIDKQQELLKTQFEYIETLEKYIAMKDNMIDLFMRIFVLFCGTAFFVGLFYAVAKNDLEYFFIIVLFNFVVYKCIELILKSFYLNKIGKEMEDGNKH